MRDKYHDIMMKTAELFAGMSYCKRGKVGAVLTKDNRILATGYNGTIPNFPNKCEDTFYQCPHCGAKATALEDLFFAREVYYLHYFTSEGKRYALDIYCTKCNKVIKQVTSDKVLVKDNLSLLIEPSYKTSEFTVHAEQNIITYCAKKGISTEGASMYITVSPCKHCAKLIAQAGIQRVIYRDEYRDRDGIDFLKQAGVEVIKYH